MRQEIVPKPQKVLKISNLHVNWGSLGLLILHRIFEIRVVLKSGWPRLKFDTIRFWGKEKIWGFGAQVLGPQYLGALFLIRLDFIMAAN